MMGVSDKRHRDRMQLKATLGNAPKADDGDLSTSQGFLPTPEARKRPGRILPRALRESTAQITS